MRGNFAILAEREKHGLLIEENYGVFTKYICHLALSLHLSYDSRNILRVIPRTPSSKSR